MFFLKKLGNTCLTGVNQIVHGIRAKVSDGIARSKIDLSNLFFRNVPSQSVSPYKASQFACPTILKPPNCKADSTTEKFELKLTAYIIIFFSIKDSFYSTFRLNSHYQCERFG